MDDNNKNVLTALGLTIAILFLWQTFYMGPKIKAAKKEQLAIEKAEAERKKRLGITPDTKKAQVPADGKSSVVPRPSSEVSGGSAVPVPSSSLSGRTREEVLSSSQRVPIENGDVTGSISLTGARIDDIVLSHYNNKLDPKSGKVVLLSPEGSKHPFYSEHGWAAGDETHPVAKFLPNKNTVWQIEKGEKLTPSSPVTLKYDSGKGLIFRRTFSIDKHYMIGVKQEVENTTANNVQLFPYGLVSRHEKPETIGIFILHEGLVGVQGEEGLQEISYDEAVGVKSFKGIKSGWMGITDKYWANILIPPQNVPYNTNYQGSNKSGHWYQTDFLSQGVTIPAAGKADVMSHVFAGAKKSRLVDGYADKMKIDRFDLLMDWGWFYFITKPLFWLLEFFNDIFGNFGIAILAATVVIKLLLFYFANLSYASMAKIRKLQPEMERIKKLHEGDNMKVQQAVMELYKKEKVNPLSGCLPILVQIPIFFALYKVLFVTIEMRHAPFFGWVQDLSAPDPTSIFNLFGLLPYDVPIWMAIGIWPILMGITMWIQMQLSPQQTDPIQQQIFNWMPFVFTFLLATFPAGLVIYWTWNNILSILQQYVIMRKHDVDIPLIENITSKISALRPKKNNT